MTDGKIIRAAAEAMEKCGEVDRLLWGALGLSTQTYTALACEAVAAVEPLIRAAALRDHELANGGCVPGDAYRDAETHIREQIAKDIEVGLASGLQARVATATEGPLISRLRAAHDAAKIARGGVS